MKKKTFPKNPSKEDYMKRQSKTTKTIMERYGVKVHTRRIERFGLAPQMVIRISGYHSHDRSKRVSQSEAKDILKVFKEQFPEMGQIKYIMGM